MKRNLVSSIIALSLLQGLHAASISVYVGAPDAQTSAHSGTVYTENFNNTTIWSQGVQGSANVASDGLSFYGGTYHFTGSTGYISPADQYGGAGGTGQYIAMGEYWTHNNNPYSLSFNTQLNYFGFWFSAGDPYNFVALYNNGVQIAVFTSADIFGALKNGVGQIQAVDGNFYNTIDITETRTTDKTHRSPTPMSAFISTVSRMTA